VASLRVSVIISTYNRGDHLPATLDCLLQQTRVPDEIIVVDDGSTDHTQDVLKRYGPPVISLWQANQGLSAGRNRGLELATGDLIAFLDSDDLLALDSIEKRAAILEAHPEYDVVYSNVQMVSAKGDVLGLYTEFRPGPRPSGDVYAHLAQYNLMPVHAYMFRRACLDTTGVFDTALYGMQDYDLWLRMAEHFQFYFLDEPLAQYILHDTMMTVRQKPKMQQDHAIIRRRIYQSPAFQRLSGREQATVFLKHGMQRMIDGHSRDGRALFRKAIAAAPAMPSAYVLFGLSLLGGRAFNAVHAAFQRARGVRTISGT
jgi:glycosyltransferase involved in cell wall biosynthesis